MPHGRTTFPSKGYCIYCGASNKPLTDEHIVPLSLGGVHVIEKASCNSCNKITAKFEQDVTRGMWGDARISYNAPTRRRKTRPTHIQLVDPSDKTTYLVPYRDYPAPIFTYQMSRAGLLEGLPEDLDISPGWKISTITDTNRAKEFQERYGRPLTAKFRHVPKSFGRLIAKIGYGQVLTSLDVEDFTPICLPHILDDKRNVSYVVGGSLEYPPPIKELGYSLRMMGFGDYKRMMILVEVRLYANNSMPVYHVVVGEIRGQTNIDTALKKLDYPEIHLFPPYISAQTFDTTKAHWLPSIWPLPN